MKDIWNETDEQALAALEAEMKGDLRAVWTSATVYAERAWQRRPETRTAMQRTSRWIALGAFSAALLCGAVGWRIAHRPAAPSVAVQVPALSDEALLEQVNRDLSTAIPAAMEPLAVAQSQSAAKRGDAVEKAD